MAKGLYGGKYGLDDNLKDLEDFEEIDNFFEDEEE